MSDLARLGSMAGKIPASEFYDIYKSLTITSVCDNDVMDSEPVFIPMGEPVTKVWDIEPATK